ncbi:MAG: thioredoxin family protein [Desulfurococcales archaeon]|nr:thioredoxin family protein [Desulfurococcales archaeon]
MAGGAIDRLLRILHLRTLEESLALLDKLRKNVRLVLLVEEAGQAGAVREYVKTLEEKSKGKITVEVLTVKLPETTPPPCLGAAMGEKRFTYCGDLPPPLFPVVVQFVLALGGAPAFRCLEVNPPPADITLFVVSGLPCIITGYTLAEYLYCAPQASVTIINAETLNRRAGRKVISAVPTLVINKAHVHVGSVMSLKELVKILEVKSRGGGEGA